MNTFEQWKRARQECRVNLYYLCRVLGYNDVQQAVHGDLITNLQTFKGGIDAVETKQLPNLKEGEVALPNVQAIREGYKPFIPDFWDLDGPRKRANFFPRGTLKTTIQTFAHTLQWIINYANVRVLLSTHTDGAAKEMVNELRKHFTANASFRYLFPEHVPWGGDEDKFGNQEHFDTPARTKWTKEHTFSFLTIGSHLSSRHFDVIKHEDLVDAENVKTVDRIASVRQHLGDMEPLLEKHEHPTKGEMKGWEDLAGTFYDFSDANYTLWETENNREPDKRIWSVAMRSAAPNYPEGPFLWPGRIGPKALKEVEDDPNRGPAILAAQYLMNPIPPGSGLIESKDEIIWTPRRVINEIYARLTLYATVDLAGMDTAKSKSSDNDYSVITLGGFGTDGHLYIPTIYHGRPSPEQVINYLFDLYAKHPRIIQIKIEKEAHARVLLKFLRAEESRRGIWLPIMELQRDNQTSKQQKIRGLQPWFKRGMIHFADDLPCKTAIINEIMRFPKFNHDDILDTLCDLMSSRDGRVAPEVMGDGPQDASRESHQLDYEAAIYGQQSEEFTSEAIMGW